MKIKLKLINYNSKIIKPKENYQIKMELSN